MIHSRRLQQLPVNRQLRSLWLFVFGFIVASSFIIDVQAATAKHIDLTRTVANCCKVKDTVGQMLKWTTTTPSSARAKNALNQAADTRCDVNVFPNWTVRNEQTSGGTLDDLSYFACMCNAQDCCELSLRHITVPSNGGLVEVDSCTIENSSCHLV